MITSKGPMVPIKPTKSIELLVAYFQHRMWAIGNTNLSASISIPMWKIWAGFSDQEVETSKNKHSTTLVYFVHPWTWCTFFHSIYLIKVYHFGNQATHKRCVATWYNGKDSNLSDMWNVQCHTWGIFAILELQMDAKDQSFGLITLYEQWSTSWSFSF